MWESFAFGTAFAWAIATLFDKILLQGRLPSRTAYLILQSVVGIVPVLGLCLSNGQSLSVGVATGQLLPGGDPLILALALLSGMLESVFVLGYYRALQRRPTRRWSRSCFRAFP